MTDNILKLLSVGLLVAFFAILGWFVREIDLIAVCALTCALAIYDFWIRPRRTPAR